tara:strand:- start:503 stop:868 length:366 start_codon:yes stop_codon:yes gene_type:complete
MSWANIVRKSGPQIKQNGSILNIDGFETRVNILKWNNDGKKQEGDCTVFWGIQLIVRDDYIREMGAGVEKIVFDDGTVYDEEDIGVDSDGKAFITGTGRFHPMSVYMDEQDESPLVTFEAY